MGTRPLPCTLSLCYSQSAGELIRLLAHLSLNSGLPVGSRVAPALTKLVRLSACVSCVVVSPVPAESGACLPVLPEGQVLMYSDIRVHAGNGG